MRRRQAVLCAVLIASLAACSTAVDDPAAHTAPAVTPDDAGAVDTPEPQSTETAASAPPAKPAKPVAFTGKSSKKTKPFNLASPARIDMTHSGSGNFIVSIYDTDNTPVEFVSNEIGKVKATTWVYGKEGKVYFDVVADGKWTIKVTRASPPVKAVPVEFAASYAMTTVPFEFDGDVTITYTHKGRGNFIVSVLETETGEAVDSVANEIGRVSGDTQLYGLSGAYAFNVIADGAWTIVVRPA